MLFLMSWYAKDAKYGFQQAWLVVGGYAFHAYTPDREEVNINLYTCVSLFICRHVCVLPPCLSLLLQH